MDFLGPEEIERVELEHANGVTARYVVQLFSSRRVRFSEATFRKYVQAGLLPRSRRVGHKGKHRGSTGLYPVAVVRRVNAIKKMMKEGMTLEDIRRSFVYFKNHIDQVDQTLDEVFDGFEQQLDHRPFGQAHRRELEGTLHELRRRGEELVRDVTRLGSAVTAAPGHGAATNG